MGADLIALAQSLPTGQLIGAIVLVILASLIVGRILTTKFVGKNPPVWEDIPFIGGVMKFAKVGPHAALQRYTVLRELARLIPLCMYTGTYAPANRRLRKVW